jgi:5-(carboxyamino)imidazole ribonucleotide synthase
VAVGDYRSYDDVAAFAAGCDVVTFDHEHVPLDVVDKLAGTGVVVRPGPHALPYVQDKIRMRERLGALGVDVPAWAPVSGVDEVAGFAAEYGWPVVAKTASGGYDGKGVWVVADRAAAATVVDGVERAGLRLYVEERIPFDRELAAVVARSASGEVRSWPVVETVQRAGICHEVLAPAPALPPSLATEGQLLAERIATDLDVVGVLAVELFEVGGRLVVNELAMRPHNSAHWTIDGAVTSQFEQHLRAVLDWPLGDPAARAPATAMVNLLGAADPAAADLATRLPAALAAEPSARIHLYGKAIRPGRKIGHVSVAGADVDTARAQARLAAAVLSGEGSA